MYWIFIVAFIANFIGYSDQQQLGAQHYNSAHAIVVSHYGFHGNGEPKQYVLFGQMKSGKLSTFGGLRDHGEKDPKWTAAREVEEETLGVLGNGESIRSQLHGIHAIYGKTNGNLCYVIPGKFYGSEIARKFRKIRFNKHSHLSHSQKEMIDIVAVRVEEVKRQVNNGGWIEFKDNQGNLCPVRSCVVGALKVAVANGAI